MIAKQATGASDIRVGYKMKNFNHINLRLYFILHKFIMQINGRFYSFLRQKLPIIIENRLVTIIAEKRSRNICYAVLILKPSFEISGARCIFSVTPLDNIDIPIFRVEK